MLCRRILLGAVGLSLFGLAACEGRLPHGSTKVPDPSTGAAGAEAKPRGPALFEQTAARTPVERQVHTGLVGDPIIVSDCKLQVIDTQEVSSQRDGVVGFIGREIKEGEVVPSEKIVSPPLRYRSGLQNGGQISMTKGITTAQVIPDSTVAPVRMANHLDAPVPEVERFCRLYEGDKVAKDQLLGRLEDTLARHECAIKKGKLAQSITDFKAAENTRDEADARYKTTVKLHNRDPKSAPDEEVRGAKATWDKFLYEAISKREGIQVAEDELKQAETVLKMHEIRSDISGVIKLIYKKKGEAVKSLEPVLQIHNYERLRVEGFVEVQYLPLLHLGMPVVIEAAQADGPLQPLIGHLGEVTSVAVGRDGKQNDVIATGSEDGTVRVWERSATRWQERRVLLHPAAVRAVACTPPAAEAKYLLTGAADGVARIWDLDNDSATPVHELKKAHRGAITCVAFSPNGQWFATGGEDRAIVLWDTATGKQQFQFPAGHHTSAITSVHFTPNSQLVSTGRDNTLRLWSLETEGARLEATLDRRSGDVADLGVSPDGKRVLFDQGKVLRLLSLPEQRNEGYLQNPSRAQNFSTFAMFSPDGQLILTAGAAEGRLQLWRAPSATSRGYEVRQLVATERGTPSCAAFAPDGSFLVTGTRAGQAYVWPVPSRAEIEQVQKATITLIEKNVDASARHVKIWAEMPNPGERLLPGGTVTMAIYPGK